MSERDAGPRAAPTLTYREAGVDVAAGNELVRRIKPLARSTARPGVVDGLGGFGALFELPLDRYRDPLLVSGTDGVGTKLKLAIDLARYDSVGIDLVAMCVNDIVTLGAEPLFFLDYFATGRLDLDVAETVIAGIARGCRDAGAALIGGETAEMPGIYRDADIDLAGFCVGIVERSRVIDGSRVAPGHALLALASSGLHANGFSLVRRILAEGEFDLDTEVGGRSLGETLLEPTRIYASSIRALLDADLPLAGLAHITGGGILENVARIIPPGLQAELVRERWQAPPVYEWLEHAAALADDELHRTFNCGLGMVIALPASRAAEAAAVLVEQGERVFEVGTVREPGSDGPAVVVR